MASFAKGTGHSGGISHNYCIFTQPYLHHNKTHLILSKQNLAQNKLDHRKGLLSTNSHRSVSLVSARPLPTETTLHSAFLGKSSRQDSVYPVENLYNSDNDTVIMSGRLHLRDSF